MTRKLKCVASAFGSAGDFLPTFSIAAALHRAGHDVRFVSNPFYEQKARAEGLRFVAAGEHVDVFAKFESEPVYVDALRGPDAIFRDFAVPDATATYHAVRDLLRDERADVVVTSNVSPGGFWAAVEARVPNVLVAASPLAWLDAQAPAQFTDWSIPEWALGLACGATRAVVMQFLDGRLAALAARLGVRVDDPSHTGAERASDLHLGMWSRHMRDRVTTDGPSRVVCGFTQAGHLGHAPELDPEIEDFLDAGEAPVVIGLGSIFALTAHAELTHAIEACAELGMRCLVIGHPREKWHPPKGTLAVRYAPHGLVFPRAKAIVTHGGAGSTSEALRSGRPVVVAPFGFDQFAIAWQVERLGSGVRLPKRGRDRAAWRRALERATTDEAIEARAAELGRMFRAERDGAHTAVEHIESLFARGH